MVDILRFTKKLVTSSIGTTSNTTIKEVILFNYSKDTTYDSYESLFITANGYFKNTAVKELMNSGIPKEKIVIGKPVTPGDASNTGWISAIDFHNWSQRAANEIGW